MNSYDAGLSCDKIVTYPGTIQRKKEIRSQAVYWS